MGKRARQPGPWDRRKVPSREARIRELRRKFKASTRPKPSRARLLAYALIAFLVTVVIGLTIPYAPRVAQVASNSTIHVIDGDTLRLASGERVRVLNIDAPEMPGRAKCQLEATLALEAKAELARMIRGANDISLRRGTDGRLHDSYGRSLRHIYVDGADVGETLIAKGLAQPWRGRHAEWC